MESRKGGRSPWTQTTLESLVELWREQPALYDVSHLLFHNRLQKEKIWRELATTLQQPVEEVKTRALSLRTQFSRLIKPKPNGKVNKALTDKQRWLLSSMDFIRPYIVHRPCDTTHDISFPAEELDPSDSRPEGSPCMCGTSSASDSSPPSSPPADWTDAEDPPYTQPPTKRRPARTTPAAAAATAATRDKRKECPTEEEIEMQKLALLKQMAAKVRPPDQFTTFGNQVASELRQIKNPASLTKIKRSIMLLLYDAQEAEQHHLPALHAIPNALAPMRTPTNTALPNTHNY